MNTLVRQWRRMGKSEALRRRLVRVPSLEVLEDRCLPSAGFTQINLDSDIPGLARVTDSNLVNPWGIAFSPTGAFWLGDNGTSVSDVVDGNGQLLPIVVSIPGTNGSPARPTGTVYNGGPGFQVTANNVSGPAHFLFASKDGTISAWNPRVDDAHAFVVIDNSTHGAEYMGLAMADGTDGQSYLYAADFGRGEIDVFDQNFHQIATPGAFTDPSLPAGFAPFNVQNINGQLFVAYAKKDTAGTFDVPAAGNGFIDVFSPSGDLVERLASGGPLNAPWGMAVAPQSFGSLSGALLVGNNGDGRISAYNLHSGAYLGQLTDNAGNPLVIEGLWGLTAGNDHLGGNSQTIFFAAGINHGQHGLFGAIQNSQARQSGTAGTLPYDPNSISDDYPLPPAHGPTLGNDFGQSTPTPVLISASNSSFALAPTLSISSGSSEDRTVFSFVPVRSLTAPEGIQGSSNLDVAIGAIPWPGGLTAFSPSVPMTLISSDRPTDKLSDPFDPNAVDATTPISLLFLGPYPSTDFAEPEGAFLFASAELSPIQLQAGPQSELGKVIPPDGIAQNFDKGWSLYQIGTIAEEENQPPKTPLQSNFGPQSTSFAEPAAAAVVNPPATPFHVSVIRGLVLVVAVCLPWGHHSANVWRGRKGPSLRGRN